MTKTSSPFFLPFEKKERLTHDAWTFYFRRNGNEREFRPGQYFEIKLEISDIDERGDTRVFTISSSPTNKEFFTITTRILQSSFKNTLAQLTPGNLVQFDGPWDDLEIELGDGKRKIFLAGGIGVTPFHSIIQYCNDREMNLPITLFNSWSRGEEVIFHNFFREKEKNLSNFTYVPTLTQDEDFKDWDGERGRINQSVIERHVVNPETASYYIVGPGGFIKGMENVLLDMKVPQNNITFEHFSGY